MKHISIIIPVGSSIVDTIIAPYNLLSMANSYHKKLNGLTQEIFKIDLVGLTKETVCYQKLFSVLPTATIDEISDTDLIIVSPISGNIEKEIDNNRTFITQTGNYSKYTHIRPYQCHSAKIIRTIKPGNKRGGNKSNCLCGNITCKQNCNVAGKTSSCKTLLQFY